MNDLNIKDEALTKFKPFLDIVLDKYKDKIHSIHITGSALTDDFSSGASDINSIIVLNKMDLKFLEDFAPLGKKFGKKQISSPLIMTPDYITSSLDVFPVEFLTIKLLHKTVFGEDIFNDLEINSSDLRYQCERELKVKLIGLRQGYLSIPCRRIYKFFFRIHSPFQRYHSSSWENAPQGKYRSAVSFTGCIRCQSRCI